jgi:hypothetical protein
MSPNPQVFDGPNGGIREASRRCSDPGRDGIKQGYRPKGKGSGSERTTKLTVVGKYDLRWPLSGVADPHLATRRFQSASHSSFISRSCRSSQGCQKKDPASERRMTYWETMETGDGNSDLLDQ